MMKSEPKHGPGALSTKIRTPSRSSPSRSQRHRRSPHAFIVDYRKAGRFGNLPEEQASPAGLLRGPSSKLSGLVGWGNDYVPFVIYMLGVITARYKELDGRFEIVASPASNEESTRVFFARLVGTATKSEIMDANPGMSQRTLERILAKLQNEGAIEKVGAARATAYRVTR